MEFNDACNNVCHILPEGYIIEIFLEKGSGTVRLEDPDGEGVQCSFDDMSIQGMIWEAIKQAKKDSLERHE